MKTGPTLPCGTAAMRPQQGSLDVAEDQGLTVTAMAAQRRSAYGEKRSDRHTQIPSPPQWALALTPFFSQVAFCTDHCKEGPS